MIINALRREKREVVYCLQRGKTLIEKKKDVLLFTKRRGKTLIENRKDGLLVTKISVREYCIDE